MNDNLCADLKRILGFTTLPGRGKIPNLELTWERITDWQKITPPPRTEERGGSSSPREVEERREDDRVAKWAQVSEREFRRLLPVFYADLEHGFTESLIKTSRRLARIVELATIPIDHSKIPGDNGTGCVSCSRQDTKRRLGPHFEPIAARYQTKAMCVWCGEFANANGGEWPPLEAVDIRARQGTQAAGRWLARNGIKTRKRKGRAA